MCKQLEDVCDSDYLFTHQAEHYGDYLGRGMRSMPSVERLLNDIGSSGRIVIEQYVRYSNA
jgi:hypothetical protein